MPAPRMIFGIGTDIVAKAPPDGYTLLMVFVNFVIQPSLYEKLPYDSVRDFAPLTTLAATPLVLVVQPQFPAKSVRELIALGKERTVARIKSAYMA